MKTLSALVDRDSYEVPAFALDPFQKKLREGLHLEFFLSRGRLILTPHLSHLATAEATPGRGGDRSGPSWTRSRTCSSS